MSDVGGLISPRALLGVNGKKDGLHHHADVDAAMAHVKAIYEAAGASERFEHAWGQERASILSGIDVAVYRDPVVAGLATECCKSSRRRSGFRENSFNSCPFALN